jgi:hypothetical protein
MKAVKLSLVIMAAALLTIGLGGVAYAFHDGGVAYCEGCHTMHNSLTGAQMYNSKSVGSKPKGSVGTANSYLLQGSDQSSTCLMCHAATDAAPSGYHVMTYPAPAAGSPAVEMTPGGDFAWVSKGYSWALPRAGTSLKDSHGHNVIAFDFNLVADARFPGNVAPGGSYPTGSLGCQSCHDPHGKYRIVDNPVTTPVKSTIGQKVLPIGASGSSGALPTADYAVGVYRLLGGNGYYTSSAGAGYAFTNDSPIAVAPSTYNRAETTNDTRVAYGKGMSEWCSNCHALFHGQASGSSGSEFKHPSGASATLTADVVNNYNAYVKSGDLTGLAASSYTSLVPFEEGGKDLTVLASHAVIDGSQKGGPTTSNNVMCLSCHRAHASAWDSAGRWNFRAQFLTLEGAYPGTDAPSQEGKDNAQGRTQAEWQAGMYGRPASNYAYYQRNLCNKCHAKD